MGHWLKPNCMSAVLQKRRPWGRPWLEPIKYRWARGINGSFYLVGGLEHEFYFPLSWECHHPNWRTHIFHRGWNHQPVPLYLNNISPLLAGWEQPLCPQIDPRNDRSQSSSGPTARGSDPVTMCWLVTPLGAILPWLLFILGSIFPMGKLSTN